MLINDKDVSIREATCDCGEPYVLVDVWLWELPPGPRGRNPDNWIRVYADRQMDPDDLLHECPGCGRDADDLIAAIIDKR